MALKLKKPDIKKVGKQVGRTAAGAGMALSLLLGSLFGSPAELTDDEKSMAPQTPPAVVQQVSVEDAYDNFTLEEPQAEEEEKRTLRDRLRQLIMKLPVWVRAVFLTPCWAVGFGFMQAISLLGTLLKIPILGAALRVLLGAALIFCLIILAQKLLFPEIPLKKLFSKKNLIPLGAACAVIAAAGVAGDIFWHDKRWITFVIQACAAGLYTGYFALFARHDKRLRLEA